MSTLLPEKLTRWPYFVRLVILVLALMVVCMGVMLPIVMLLKRFGGPVWPSRLLLVLLIVAFFYLRIRYLDIPRIRDIGWPPGLLLFYLVPLAGTVLALLLFFTPSKAFAPEPPTPSAGRSAVPTTRGEGLADLGSESGW